ncbi:hypothetical protein P7K49_034808 [Saguinus oedipus]|uniref:Uncharacterized protein n=1 Tax=Saguinus oedipus TaxID=9490 RepID=A0ABQ9TVS8_SAGOE|nr:hypothetical protein P7K49_034808 [Saguinus oedipus]
MFMCGHFFIRPSGIYFIRLLSDHWIGFPIIVIVTLETMAVSWAYGARRTKSGDGPITASTSLSPSDELTSSEDVQKEEILQGDETKYPSTCRVTS